MRVVDSGWPGRWRKPFDKVSAADHSRRMDIRIQCLCIDTGNPAAIASFWQSALGWRRTFESDDEVVLEPPAGSPEDGVAPDLLFLRVPEGKVVKNRLHLDLRPGDQAAEVARLEALGARRVSIGQGEVSWVVMTDPDGNEFDVLRPLTPAELAEG
jgi:catechol 2,3-dioxygenase-like lactoylglutathione lyase family enzyme